MASFAVSTTATRMGRILHWLFPSRRVAVAVAAVEAAAGLLGLPLALHIVVGLAAHIVIAALRW
jgi:hypothetical protein